MEFIREQLVKHRSLVGTVFVLETVYTFYMGRSLLVLFLRLMFYMNILSLDWQKSPEASSENGNNATTTSTSSAHDPSNSSGDGGPPASAAGSRRSQQAQRRGSTAAPARNYLGTGVRPAPAAPPGNRSRDAAPARTLESAVREGEGAPDSLSSEEEVEARKSSMLRDVLLAFVLALLNHLILPLAARGWAWYWLGPASLRPHREAYKTGKHDGIDGEVRYHAAVSSAFMKDYSTWHSLIDQGRYYMDFLAADEPPSSLLLKLYRGNPNLPLFLTTLDVLLVVLQIIMLKMSFPEDYGMRVDVVMASPPAAGSGGEAAHADDGANNRDASVREGQRGGDAESAPEDPAPQTDAAKQGPPPPPPPPQSREEAEATLQRVMGGPHSSNSGSGSEVNSAGSSTARTKPTRRKHLTADGVGGGGGGGYEKLLSTAREEATTTAAAKAIVEGEDVAVDFLDGQRPADGAAKGLRETMDVDTAGDSDGVHSGRGRRGGSGPGAAARRLWQRMTSPFEWGVSLSGGLISGGAAGGQGASKSFSPTGTLPSWQRRDGDEGGLAGEGRGRGGACGTSRLVGLPRSATSRGGDGEKTGLRHHGVAHSSSENGRSFRCTMNYMKHLARSLVSHVVQGWSWELVTIEVPPEHVPASVRGTLITVHHSNS